MIKGFGRPAIKKNNTIVAYVKTEIMIFLVKLVSHALSASTFLFLDSIDLSLFSISFMIKNNKDRYIIFLIGTFLKNQKINKINILHLDKMKKIILTLLLLIIISIMTGCTEDDTSLEGQHEKISKATAEKVRLMYQYTEYNPSNLEETSFQILRCSGCYQISYQFDVNTDELPDNVNGFEIMLSFADNEISNVEITEIIDDDNINSFEDCVAAGYPVMESYPRKCAVGDIVYVEEIDIENDDEIGEITQPTEPFCGISSRDSCESDSDCKKEGCSGQICQGSNDEGVVTTCEYKECYNAENYGLSCGCVDNQCIWN